jgi:quinol monooxygenase YgiN
MIARVVECQSTAGRSEQVARKLNHDVLPILQKQPGFVDFLTLSDQTTAERLVCVRFWTSREDAEEYQRQHYDTITEFLKPILESRPAFETFAVNASTAHRICGRQSSLSGLVQWLWYGSIEKKPCSTMSQAAFHLVELFGRESWPRIC